MGRRRREDSVEDAARRHDPAGARALMTGGFWVGMLGVLVIIGGSTGSSPTAVAIGWVMVSVGSVACVFGVVRHSRQAGVSYVRSALTGLRTAFFWLMELP